ncbi:hypothetical protein FACS1894137_07800 [Spirochaetia bacterium]|nr:hypothetical protein FACS1894137_07800 [Spirochaetia bacterium]
MFFQKKPQIDLRFFSKTHISNGGQKDIEKKIQFIRPNTLGDINGKEAIVLWYQFLRGDSDSVKKLILYNYFDVLGMTFILDYIFSLIQKNISVFKTSTRFYTGDNSSGIKWLTNRQIDTIRNYVEEKICWLKESHLSAARPLKIIGIDLAGKEERNTGICVLRDDKAATQIMHTDEEIVEYILSEQPDLVSIDAPLSLPEGRTSVYDTDPERDKIGIMRYCERELKRRGVNVYPALIKSMQSLTSRGMNLAKCIRQNGIPVIECFPGAAQDIIQIPRKKTDISCLKNGLIHFGIHGEYEVTSVIHDELDAITAAIVGQFFISNLYEPIGIPAENDLIVPSTTKITPSEKLVIGICGEACSGKTTVARYIEAAGFSYIQHTQSGTLPDAEKGNQLLIIDGLQYAGDYACWKEKFFNEFVLISIKTPLEIRKERARIAGNYGDAIMRVNSDIEFLGNKSQFIVNNDQDLATTQTQVSNILATLLR